MDNQNRYEEVPQKENKFVKVLKLLGKFFKETWLNYIESFKYNEMKLASILCCFPGVFLGFFLIFHKEVVKRIDFTAGDAYVAATGSSSYVFGFDFTALVLFVLMLSGIVNIFFALGMSGKKNLGSVVKTAVVSGIIVVSGALYLTAVFVFLAGVNSGAIVTKSFAVDSNWIISIVSVIVSIATSIAGVVLGFINYDRTYEKVDR